MTTKSDSTAVMSVEDMIKQDIAAQAARLPTSGGNKIKVADKKFTFPNGLEVKGKPIEVVIVDMINSNTFYTGAYNAKSIVPPTCAAVGVIIADMKPRASIEHPVNADCGTCPKNQWGSGNGNGKACSNKIVLAVLTPDDLAGELFTIEVSSTAIKDFTKYSSALKNSGATLPMMITELSFSDDAYPSLRFKPSAPNPNIAGAYARREEASKLLLT